MAITQDTVDALRVKFEALLPHLDERATRLTLAAQARGSGIGAVMDDAVDAATGQGADRARASGQCREGRAAAEGSGVQPAGQQ